MAKPFRFAASMPRLTQPASAWRDQVRRIEDLGFSAVAISDHFTQGWVMEPLVAMTAAADATSTLRVLALVLGNDYRHPVLLHKALATLDVLSGGRVEIGLGAGWMRSDYDAAGMRLDPPGLRIDRLAESIELLKALFSAGTVDHDGRHYQVAGLDGLPKPVQVPHPPILIGGGSRRVLELAGRSADVVGINPSMRAGVARGSAVLDLTSERVAAKLAWARAAAVAAGRDPDTLHYQLSVLALEVTDVTGARPWVSSLAADAGDLAALTSPAVLRGTAARCAEELQGYRERLGLNYFHLGGDITAAAAIVARLAGT
jgi:probable F420-dependent oxidoreductase